METKKVNKVAAEEQKKAEGMSIEIKQRLLTGEQNNRVITKTKKCVLSENKDTR